MCIAMMQNVSVGCHPTFSVTVLLYQTNRDEPLQNTFIAVFNNDFIFSIDSLKLID